MPALSNEEKISAWNGVVQVLDELVPDWNDPGEGVRSPADAARTAIRRLYNAAEWGDISTTKMHLKNELSVLRGMVDLEELPPGLQQGLRAHMQRLARLI